MERPLETLALGINSHHAGTNGATGRTLWTNSNDVTLLSLVILLLDLLAVAYLLFNSRLIDSFKISESFHTET